MKPGKWISRKYGQLDSILIRNPLARSWLIYAALFALMGASIFLAQGLQTPSAHAAIDARASTINFGEDDENTIRANAVVWVLDPFPMQCTGTLVAADIVLTAGHCISPRGTSSEDALPQCADWQVPGRWYPLTSPVAIGVGHDRAHFRFQTEATQYNMPGCADMMMLRLANAVPGDIARPMQVLISAGSRAGAGDSDRFSGQNLKMVGWGLTEEGTTPRFRQTTSSLYASHTDEKMLVDAEGDSSANLGDSGGPLIWTHGSGQEYIIGVLQQTHGLYTPTFRTAVNGKPSVADWILKVLPSAVYCPDANRAPAGTLPLVSWWNPDPGYQDNFITSDLQWAGCHGALRSPNYGFVRTEGFIFNPALPQPPGTISLYTWYDPDRRDNSTLSHPVWQHWPGDGKRRDPNYELVHLEGYVFDPDLARPAGTIPLYRWYDPDREDNWTTTQHQEAGSRGDGLTPNYRFSRLVGYVYAP